MHSSKHWSTIISRRHICIDRCNRTTPCLFGLGCRERLEPCSRAGGCWLSWHLSGECRVHVYERGVRVSLAMSRITSSFRKTTGNYRLNVRSLSSNGKEASQSHVCHTAVRCRERERGLSIHMVANWIFSWSQSVYSSEHLSFVTLLEHFSKLTNAFCPAKRLNRPAPVILASFLSRPQHGYTYHIHQQDCTVVASLPSLHNVAQGEVEQSRKCGTYPFSFTKCWRRSL